jgi:uncharacterized protein YbbK (DUF523 family)
LRAISACLLGVACRYDGRSCPHPLADRLAREEGLLPLCPEQLGGLPTPRPRAEIVGGAGDEVLSGTARVRYERGADVTSAFVRGAHEAAALCERLGVTEALLKARSPSCGVGLIQRGDALVPGDGVAAAWLRRRGIRVVPHPE